MLRRAGGGRRGLRFCGVCDGFVKISDDFCGWLRRAWEVTGAAADYAVLRLILQEKARYGVICWWRVAAGRGERCVFIGV